VDEDAVSALGDERMTRWKRVCEADFLSDAEKRLLLGLEAAAPGQ
jgi:phage portal protein BeeE